MPGKTLEEVREEIRARCDSAYLAGLTRLRSTPCLGEAHKMAHGLFGKDELDAHRQAAEMFGRHKALAEVLRLLKEVCGE